MMFNIMARIKLNPIISEISGSFSGATFQNSRAGTILKQKQVYCSNKTLLQSRINNINSYLHHQWYSFTEIERNKYSKLATFASTKQKNNNSKVLTGYELFMKNNFYFIFYNLTIVSNPSFLKSYLTQIEGSLSISLPNFYFITDRYLDSTNEFIILFCTKPHKITRTNPGSTYRLILFNTTDSDNFDITSQYLASFGRLPLSGEKVFYKYTNVDKRSSLLNPFQTSFRTTY